MGSPRKSKHWQRARSLAQLNILCQRLSAHPSQGSGDESQRLHESLENGCGQLQDFELPAELQSLSVLSNMQLQEAVEEARERSAKNRNFLMEAGERGQQLLGEEAMLECRLEECHEELTDSAHGGHDHDAGGAEWGPTSSLPSPAVRQAHRQLQLQQAEMHRIREQNELLEEELEEREQAIKQRAAAARNRKRPWGPTQSIEVERERNNQEVFQRVSMLNSEVAEASASVGRVSDTCDREHKELERELAEVQRQTWSMRGVLEKHIEAEQERNAEMQTELHAVRALRVERCLPLRNVINVLRQELQDAKSISEEAEKELCEARREVATAEASHAENSTESVAVTTLQLPASAYDMSVQRTTLQLPASAYDMSVQRRNSGSSTASGESNESEFWDGNADEVSNASTRSKFHTDAISQASEQDRESVSSNASQLGLRHKSQRREALKQQRNGYHPVEVVVHAQDDTSSAAAAAASAASAASAWGAWGYSVGASVLGDAMLKFDEYVAEKDKTAEIGGRTPGSSSNKGQQKKKKREGGGSGRSQDVKKL